jgi:hypothetical protein
MWPDKDKREVLFTAAPVAFPSKPQKLEEGLHKLYHVSLGDCGVASVMDDVGPMFLPSPDGKRVLIEKITPATEIHPAKHELAVMNVNGSNLLPLRDISAFNGSLPMWPSWRGNNQVAFISEDARIITVGEEARQTYDVVLYQLPDGGALSAVRTLSETWPDELRPWRRNEAAPTTTATTQSTTQPSATQPTTTTETAIPQMP